MERIVLGFDGSPAAVSALAWTAARASRRESKVDVVLVTAPPRTDSAPGLERLGEAEDFLRERLPGLEVELHRLQGSVAASIAEAADDADMVVVGINQGHPIRAAAAGWTPLRLSARANAPVCMVPLGWTEGDDPVTVGIADDGSSSPALEFAMTEAVMTRTQLRLVHSWLMPSPVFDYGTALAAHPEGVIEDHRGILDAAVRRVWLERPDLEVLTEFIRDSRSAALLRFASRSSLLVIGTHRRGLLAGSILGSVAQEILWRADCPVCVVPPRSAANVAAGLPMTSQMASGRDD